jgi:rhodanese-related sulfurtransferase
MSVWNELRSWAPFGAVPEVSARELHDALAGGAPPKVLDVRTRLEWQQSRIAGAVHVPLLSLGAHVADLGLGPARPVVLICLSAHRSVSAVRVLREAGFDAMQLQGGMLAWWAAGLPVEKGSRGA